jgi:hypothetical protein
MVARQDQDQISPGLRNDSQVASHGVRRSLEPTLVERGLLGSQDLDETLGESIELVGANDVPVQRDGVELRQHEDSFHSGVDRVANRDVDQPVLSGYRHRGLTALTGQWLESSPSPSAENDDADFTNSVLPVQHASLRPSVYIIARRSDLRRALKHPL